jgi:hypothetical protein
LREVARAPAGWRGGFAQEDCAHMGAAR